MSSALGDDDNVDGGIKPLAAGDPSRIGPYLLLGRLGAGGMGRVYLARSGSGRTVAVKVVHEEHVSNAQFRERFRREIDAARRVGERYTAPVLEADPDAERPWVATGYVPGLSLEQIVRRYGPLPVDAVHALADGLLRALEDIHTAGIVHRDLKPSNVMLTVEGTRVIDFGISRALETSVESLLTSTGMVVGSPGFMSPEQVRGQRAGAKSDVFTLGCVLMYAATGELPFGHGASNQHAVMFQIVEGEPDLEKVGDEALRGLIRRCLTKDVDERPGVQELLADPGRVRPARRGGAWLPPKVVARLARQAAALLDAEAAPGAQDAVRDAAEGGSGPAAADRATLDLRKGAGAPGGPVAGGGTSGGGRRERRRWKVAVPVVLVCAVGGGTVALIQPFGAGGDAAQASPPAASGPLTPGGPSAAPSGTAGGAQPPGASGPPPSPAGAEQQGQAGGAAQAGGAQGGGAQGGAAQGGVQGGGVPGGAAAGGAAVGGGGAPGGGSGSPGGGSGSPGGAGGTGTGPTKGSGAAAGGGAAGGAHGGASGTPSGGSGTPTGGGSTGGGDAVPAYFVGAWNYTAPFNIDQPVTVTIARSGAVRLISDSNMGHCENTAKVTSVGSGGSRIDVGAATVDKGKSNSMFCGPLDASFFTRSDPSGLQHNVGPAHGDGYYYARS
ncbi:serine/threonine-protein kinase [Streptomyces sp. NPDC048507]|uniref:serine/threonine-protein kinase n=1 Tax=Streptomyces sp. NPDC048507 TaxID=3365560 RepID=UPI00371213AA